MVSIPERRAAVSTAHRPRERDTTRRRFLDRHQRLPLALVVIAAIAVLASMALPYWDLTLHAPQYPRGLQIQATISEMRGQVFEVDGLNHYIGMMKLEDAAKLERRLAPFIIPVIALLAVASVWVRGRWKWLLVLPLIIYPIAFVVDLSAWLYYAGHSLDPRAALSSSIKPFTPRVLGVGTIGQFSTEAHFAIGYYLALASALLALAATIISRKAERDGH